MSFQNEQIVETKSCKQCQASFDITDKDREFYKKLSPVITGEKHILPSSEICPSCRSQRRMSFRNERNLYRRVCDATGKNIISMYRPEGKYKVYSHDFWWSDAWDIMDYGRMYDLEVSFFQQFYLLDQASPKFPVAVFGSENCEYNNFMGKAKNCYYTFAGGEMEDVYYSVWVGWSDTIFDGYKVIQSQNLYYCVDVIACSNSIYLSFCDNCSDSAYLDYCIGCRDCIACIGGENWQYYIGNKPYSRAEYFKKKKTLSLADIQKIYMDIKAEVGYQAEEIIGSENCSGTRIKDSKNMLESHVCEQCEDGKYVNWGFELTDAYDIDFYNTGSLAFETLSGAFNHRTVGVIFCSDSSDMVYCTYCFNCSFCFGCTGLQNKQYCILNKQYTKEQYEALVPKIIEKMKQDGEWGEFFPSNISPFGYSETVAQEYYPLEKQVAKEKRFNWSDYEAPFPKVEKTIPANKLPENITDIPDDILNWAIECEVTKKPFRIIPQELKFYRKHNLPIPRRHPDQRHLDRMALRNPRKLFQRTCDHPNCDVSMQATYAPERPEKVYCEACYEKEIY